MKTLYLPSEGEADRIIILFLGWGCPAGSFRRLRKPGYDLLLVSDYRDWSTHRIDTELERIRRVKGLGRYSEVAVIAWSFGVIAASEYIANSKGNITLRLAVNGSLAHVDDRTGIPAAVFAKTLAELTPASLRKFRLRTAGGKERLERYFPQDTSGEEFEELREELAMFGRLSDRPVADEGKYLWDKVIVGMSDRIFPPENLKNGWKGCDIFEEEGMAHMPDFQAVLDTFVVDKSKVEEKFSEAGGQYSSQAIVQKQAAGDLVRFIAAKVLECKRILEVGYGDGTFTREYLPLLSPGSELYLCDIKETAIQKERLRTLASEYNIVIHFIKCDAETIADFSSLLPHGEQFDMILSSSALQWFNSPTAFVRKSIASLAPGGMLALSFYGKGTLREISSVTGNGLKYHSLGWLADVADHAGATEVFADSRHQEILFPSPSHAFRHLKLTGVNALPNATSPAAIRRLVKEWPSNPTGSYPLSFECKYLIARK